MGEGGIKERMGATRTLAPIFPDNFPEHLREEYARIREDLVWVPPDEGSGQGLAESTLDTMTEDEAEILAKRLFSLYTNAAQTFYGRLPTGVCGPARGLRKAYSNGQRY